MYNTTNFKINTIKQETISLNTINNSYLSKSIFMAIFKNLSANERESHQTV